MRMLSRLGRQSARIVMALVLMFMVVSCGSTQTPAKIIYADGTRGCREAEHHVAIWSEPGAVPAGATVVTHVDHGADLMVMDEALAYGVRYYLVAFDGQTGWLPEIYSETIPPVCD